MHRLSDIEACQYALNYKREQAQAKNAPVREKGLKNQEPHNLPGNYDYEIMDPNISSRYYDIQIFDEISNQIWNTPVFTNAVLNWRVSSGALYQQCHRLGIDRVESEIKAVVPMCGIRNKGAYLLTRLRRLK